MPTSFFPSDIDLKGKLERTRKQLDTAVFRHTFFHRETDAVRHAATRLLDTAVNRIRHAQPIDNTFHKEAHLYLNIDNGLMLAPNVLLTAEKVGIPIIQDPLERIGFGVAVLEALRDMIPSSEIPDAYHDILIDPQMELNALRIAMGDHSVRLAFLYRAYR